MSNLVHTILQLKANIRTELFKEAKELNKLTKFMDVDKFNSIIKNATQCQLIDIIEGIKHWYTTKEINKELRQMETSRKRAKGSEGNYES